MTSGTFVAGDAVEEPDVFAVLPKTWLSNGVLKGVRSLAFDDTIATTRDNPQTMSDTQHWPGYTEADRALKNNFYTSVNEDDPRVAAAERQRGHALRRLEDEGALEGEHLPEDVPGVGVVLDDQHREALQRALGRCRGGARAKCRPGAGDAMASRSGAYARTRRRRVLRGSRAADLQHAHGLTSRIPQR